MALPLDYLAAFHIEVGAPVDAGPGHRLIPVLGGEVKGDRLHGRILPGGGDWQSVGADESIEIGGRWVLETPAGSRIQVETPGIRCVPADLLPALAAGEPIDPSRYYFRVMPRFVTEEAQYRWLRHSLFIGRGAKMGSRVDIEVYRVG